MFEIRDIIRAYDSRIIRAYAMVRFHILRQRFLTEIGQYLPTNGQIVDIGCGFGLFALFFASRAPERRLHGFDLNQTRVAMANSAARKLSLGNALFESGDARQLPLDIRFDAAYMLDIVHHIPPESVPDLIRWVRAHLASQGVFLIKDVADRPAYKRWFTWALDKAMDYHTPVHYWSPEDLMALLRQEGFKVFAHQMIDYLPYPHVLYICEPVSEGL